MNTTTSPRTITQTGDYTTACGDRYDPERHPNETAKLLRRDIREAVRAGLLPAVRYSVRRGHGWSDLNISVQVDLQDWMTTREPTASDPWSRPVYTDQAKETGRTLKGMALRYLRTTSDPYTDYHHGGRVFVSVEGGAILA